MATRRTIRLLPATMDHAAELASNLRQTDRDEVRASGGYTPLQATTGSVAASREAWAIYVDGRLAALYGVANSSVPGIGVPWLLGAEGFPHGIAKRLVAQTRSTILEWKARYKYARLLNWISERNGASLRWLKASGFRVVGEPVAFREPGHRFFRLEQE